MNNFIFLDSNAFLNASLSDLMKDLLKTESHPFKIMDQMNLYPEGSEVKELLLRKGIFPYDFCTSLEKLKETKEIPPIKEFYSNLTKSTVSEEEHELAKQVYDKLKCSSLLSYCEKYCAGKIIIKNMMDIFNLIFIFAVDTAQLAEVFTFFRNVTMHEFKLDPCNYLSTPALGKLILYSNGNAV